MIKRYLLPAVVALSLIVTGCSAEDAISTNVTNTVGVQGSVSATMFGQVEGDGLQIPYIDKTTGAAITIDQLRQC